MSGSAILTLAWLIATTAANSLNGPFNSAADYLNRNGTRDSAAVSHHHATISSYNGIPVAPGGSPAAPTYPTTTSDVSYGIASTGTPYRFPRPSGAPRPSANGTCHGATVNIVGASLDWWYTETTYTQVVSTFLIQVNSNDSSTAWTLLPATDKFDVTTAVANPSCKSSTAFNAQANETMLHYSCVDTPTPVAMATTTVAQTAYLPINATTSKGAIPDVVISPTPAAITIANANGSSTYAAGTPFVHFSQYDVVSKRPFLYGDGKVGCAETTQVHTMTKPGSFKYTGGNVNGSYAAVAGTVHPDVLGIVGQMNATAGSFVAKPTVVVVVHKVLAAQRMFAMIQPSAVALETPEATLPPSLSTVQETPTETGSFWSPLAAHIESPQAVLAVPTRSKSTSRKAATPTTAIPVVVPFVGHVKHQEVTLAMPMNPNAPRTVITALFDGAQLTATAVSNSVQGPEQPGQGNNQNFQQPSRAGIESVLSSIIKAAQASNEDSHVNGNVAASAVGSTNAAADAAQAGQKVNDGQNRPANAGVVTFGSSAMPVSVSSLSGGLALVIGGQTLSSGGPAITVDGTRISLASGATALVVGSSTVSLAPTLNPGAVANAPILTLAGERFTAINNGATYILGGQTLTPGGARTITINGHTYAVSLSPQAAMLEIVTLGQDGRTLSTTSETLFPAQRPSSTIYNTEPARDSVATQTSSSSDALPTGDSAAKDGPKKGKASPLAPACGVLLGMLSLSALAFLM